MIICITIENYQKKMLKTFKEKESQVKVMDVAELIANAQDL